MKGFRVMELQLWLSFLKLSIMHVAHDVQAIEWSLDIPSTIPAVEGSCLVIPCTLTYPSDRLPKSLPPFAAYWKKGDKLVSTNLAPRKPDEEFDQRTKLLGDVNSRNCTMVMNDVRVTDSGPFYLKVVIPGLEQWSFKNNPVFINVTRITDPPSMTVLVGKRVYASCSVFHSCPTMPPLFIWNHAGAFKKLLTKVNQWKWRTVSYLTFQPAASDFNKPLNCTVRYSTGMAATSSTILKRLKKKWKAW